MQAVFGIPAFPDFLCAFLNLSVCFPDDFPVLLKGFFQQLYIADRIRHTDMETADDFGTILFEQPCRAACAVSAEQSHSGNAEYFFILPKIRMAFDKIFYHDGNV